MKKQKQRQHYRQGDVLVERIASLPAKLNKVAREGGRLILAHGTATGHSHAIATERCDLLTSEKEPGVLFLSAQEPARLEHNEHSTITLPKGTFRVIRQREYAPDAIRQVQD